MTIAFRFGEKQSNLLYCESVRSFLVRDEESVKDFVKLKVE